ncbi:hypothetical protein PARMER_01824 [Parabacteroides merdae ATCC 43184]|nr:hypothetical protein PARMER_01824 [Parabacteroides merdae ATCC 43184]
MPVARPTDADPLTAGCLPDEIIKATSVMKQPFSV